MDHPKRRSNENGPRRSPSTGGIGVRPVPNSEAWELVHPRCARERAEDIEEVEHMIAAGEIEIAIDELRWLLDGCGDLIDAHRLLGELALADNDVRLARGHFGYAYQIGMKAIRSRPACRLLPFDRPANRAFLQSAKGLLVCLQQIGEPRLALDVARQLLALDPSDPTCARGILQQLEQGSQKK